jgi:hypothetical protein
MLDYPCLLNKILAVFKNKIKKIKKKQEKKRRRKWTEKLTKTLPLIENLK